MKCKRVFDLVLPKWKLDVYSAKEFFGLCLRLCLTASSGLNNFIMYGHIHIIFLWTTLSFYNSKDSENYPQLTIFTSSILDQSFVKLRRTDKNTENISFSVVQYINYYYSYWLPWNRYVQGILLLYWFITEIRPASLTLMSDYLIYIYLVVESIAV